MLHIAIILLLSLFVDSALADSNDDDDDIRAHRAYGCLRLIRPHYYYYYYYYYYDYYITYGAKYSTSYVNSFYLLLV